MNDQKINLLYLLNIAGVVLFTWLIHEFAHWVTYKSLGYDAFMRLNSAGLASGKLHQELDTILAAAAGPVITLIQAAIVYQLLMNKGWNKYIYPILFTAFYMRLVAGMLNIINLNDEGEISEYLNLGTFTIPVMLSGLLFFMVNRISNRYTIRWGFQGITLLFIINFSSILILSDQFYKIRIF